jgi:hypothetical protein
MHLHVDTKAAKAISMDAATRARLDSLRQAHAALPVPSEAGKPVGGQAKRREPVNTHSGS